VKLPPSTPPKVQELAEQVTRGLYGPYQMAVRLQDWFRHTGHFQYKLQAKPDDGKNALVDFLTRGHGGRVGSCQQFASAYAVMARTLGIPSRVVVGFLQPTAADDGDWVYSSWDLHAWPELYFQGSGWVRFEPTPGHGAVAPSWTRGHGATGSQTNTSDTPTSPPSVPTTHLTTTPSATPADTP